MLNIEKQKRVIINRGISGSGKSTFAQWMIEMAAGPNGEVWEENHVLYSGRPSLSLKVEMLSRLGEAITISDDQYPHQSEIAAAIHSTDRYFLNKDGEYRWNPSRLHINHNANYKAFRNSVDCGIPLIIVDNTNTQEREYSKYLNYAKDEGYWISFNVMPHPKVEDAVKRNGHNVPEDAIQKMIARFE